VEPYGDLSVRLRSVGHIMEQRQCKNKAGMEVGTEAAMARDAFLWGSERCLSGGQADVHPEETSNAAGERRE